MSDRNQWCFACGSRNPIGLKLTFREEADTYYTTLVPGPEYQGYEGVMHGGLVSTLLDEVMARYLYAKGFNAVTAKLEVRFRQPTPIGQQLTVSGWITGKRGKMYELAGKIILRDGTVTAESKATVVIKGDG